MSDERLVKISVFTKNNSDWHMIASAKEAQTLMADWSGIAPHRTISIKGRVSDIDGNEMIATWSTEEVVAIDIVEINQALGG